MATLKGWQAVKTSDGSIFVVPLGAQVPYGVNSAPLSQSGSGSWAPSLSTALQKLGATSIQYNFLTSGFTGAGSMASTATGGSTSVSGALNDLLLAGFVGGAFSGGEVATMLQSLESYNVITGAEGNNILSDVTGGSDSAPPAEGSNDPAPTDEGAPPTDGGDDTTATTDPTLGAKTAVPAVSAAGSINWTGIIVRVLEAIVGFILLALGLHALTGGSGNPVQVVTGATKKVAGAAAVMA